MRRRGILLILCMLLAASGCGKGQERTKIVLTTGFEADEIFRIEGMSCSLPEVMVFLTNTQNQYESVYGQEIWNMGLEGVTMEESVKETVLAELAQIKTMNLLAYRSKVVLDEEEERKVREAAAVYYESLNQTEREKMQVSLEIIENLYFEYALAEKVYQYIIKDINPEISDDEARTITVQHIFFKTCSRDGTGEKIEYSEEEKENVRSRALEVLDLAREVGSDFEQLILTYSEDETGTRSFGKGEMDPEFEEAAFNLETGEISGLVQTGEGYHIIKCISTFNREETDANKVKIVEKRRKEVFGQEYEAFVSSLTRDLNTELWQRVSFIHDSEVKTADFFEIYSRSVSLNVAASGS